MPIILGSQEAEIRRIAVQEAEIRRIAIQTSPGR
jgi:hypothetical protein